MPMEVAIDIRYITYSWGRQLDAHGGGDGIVMDAAIRCLWRRRWNAHYRGGDGHGLS